MTKVSAIALVLSVAVFFSPGGSSSAATVTVYSDFLSDFDKTAWSGAVGGSYKTETFTDKYLEPEISYTTLKGSISPQGYWHDTLNSWSSNPSETVWTFTPQMYAFGGDWTLGGPGGSGNSLKVTINELDFTGYISSRYYGNFWGVVSDKSFSEILLTGGTGTNQQIYFLDNLVFGPVAAPVQLTFLRAGALGAVPAAATPLPGAIWLVGGGLLLLAGLRKFN